MPPNVHFSKLNPTIDLEDFAAEIPITTTALSGSMLSSGGIELTWDPGDHVGGVPSLPSKRRSKRRLKRPFFEKASGLSSFGFGGTNAHVTCKSSEEVVETKAGQ